MQNPVQILVRIFIQFANFPQYYLVMVVNDNEFRFALISTRKIPDCLTFGLVIKDKAWLNYSHIRAAAASQNLSPEERTGASIDKLLVAAFRAFDMNLGIDRFKFETGMIHDL